MDALTSNQQQLFENVRIGSKRRARMVVQHAKLRKDQKRKLRLARRKLEQASLVVNLRLRDKFGNQQVVDNLLEIGRLMGIIEAGQFPGGIHDLHFRERLLNEFKIYGATKDAQTIFSHMDDSERPSYGALDYIKKPTSLASIKRFGHYRFVLKPYPKTRSTFTPADSVAVEKEQVFTWENIEGVLATKLDGRFWFEHVLAGTEPFSVEEGVYYIEAQIMGGVRLADIERLYYPAAAHSDPEFFAKLQRLESDHGIALVRI